MESKRIWEAQEQHWSLKQKQWEQEQEERIIKGITCFCDDCNFWLPNDERSNLVGGKCADKNIELSYTNVDGKCICECNTYEPTEKVDC